MVRMTYTTQKHFINYRYYITFHLTILLVIHTSCHPIGTWDGNFFFPPSSSSSSSSSSLPQLSRRSSSSLLISSPNQITKRASDDYNSSFADCTLGNPLRDTCERCSKASRSRDAYAKCCQSPGEVRTFCEALLTYTFPGRPRKLSRIHPPWWYLP